MMEVQIDDAPVVAAHRAAAARLGDQGPLDLLQPARDRLARATLAPPPETPLAGARQMKLHETMVRALPKLGCAQLGRWATRLVQ